MSVLVEKLSTVIAVSFLSEVSISNSLVANYAGTVFAYGVTSSGKTHTMHVSVTVFSWDFVLKH